MLGSGGSVLGSGKGSVKSGGGSDEGVALGVVVGDVGATGGFRGLCCDVVEVGVLVFACALLTGLALGAGAGSRASAVTTTGVAASGVGSGGGPFEALFGESSMKATTPSATASPHAVTPSTQGKAPRERRRGAARCAFGALTS